MVLYCCNRVITRGSNSSRRPLSFMSVLSCPSCSLKNRSTDLSFLIVQVLSDVISVRLTGRVEMSPSQNSCCFRALVALAMRVVNRVVMFTGDKSNGYFARYMLYLSNASLTSLGSAGSRHGRECRVTSA